KMSIRRPQGSILPVISADKCANFAFCAIYESKRLASIYKLTSNFLELSWGLIADDWRLVTSASARETSVQPNRHLLSRSTMLRRTNGSSSHERYAHQTHKGSHPQTA